jgi:hypothetical protein
VNLNLPPVLTLPFLYKCCRHFVQIGRDFIAGGAEFEAT